MSHSKIILFVLASSWAGLTQAADSAAVQEPVGSYQLKHRSAFSPPENARPPFWPVGHIKQKIGGPDPRVVVINISPEMFSLTSVVVGNPSLAIINGRAYGEGETVRIGPRGSGAIDSRLKVWVTRIADGQVTLRAPDGQLITVLLRRSELMERKAEPEALLSQDQDR